MTPTVELNRVSLEELLAIGDQFAAGDRPAESLTTWLQLEEAERATTEAAWAREAVDVEGATLVPGSWYDVIVHPMYGKRQSWLGCRYLGRRRIRHAGYLEPSETFEFERWGGKPSMAWAKTDRVGLRSLAHATAIVPSEVQREMFEEREARSAAKAGV